MVWWLTLKKVRHRLNIADTLSLTRICSCIAWSQEADREGNRTRTRSRIYIREMRSKSGLSMSPNDVDDRSNSWGGFKDLAEAPRKEFRGRHDVVSGIQTSYRSISWMEFRDEKQFKWPSLSRTLALSCFCNDDRFTDEVNDPNWVKWIKEKEKKKEKERKRHWGEE